MDNRRKNKLTLVMIPDDARPVRKTQFSRKLLYIIPTICIVVIIVLTYWQVGRHLDFTQTIQRLSAQMATDRTGYESTIAEKNETIQQLHDELFSIVEQAEVLQRQLAELKAFERELRLLSDLPLSTLDFDETEEARRDGLDEAALGREGYNESALGLNGYDFNKADDMRQDEMERSSVDSVRIASVGGVQRMATREEVRQLIQETEAAMQLSGERMQQLNEALEEVKQAVLAQQKQMRHTPSIWPVNSRDVTSGYGFRRDPFTRATSFHSGIDIAARTNAYVMATADGEVEAVGRDSAKGNYIVIDHAYGLKTQYMHLNQILINQGDVVEKGQMIGSVGSTGRSTGPHIHYEVIKHGKTVDPAIYLTDE